MDYRIDIPVLEQGRIRPVSKKHQTLLPLIEQQQMYEFSKKEVYKYIHILSYMHVWFAHLPHY